MRTEISHGNLIAALSEALQLPALISVIHRTAHTGWKEEVSKGNNFANRMQKLLLKHS